MQLKTHKLHKYLKLKSDEYLISKRSIYHRFGQYVLRFSDHIGKTSSGTYSIIVDKRDNYLLHTHGSGHIISITYEEAKDFVRSLYLCADLAGHVGIEWEREKEKAAQPVITADEASKLRCELERMKHDFTKLTKEAQAAYKGNNKLNDKLNQYREYIHSLGLEDPLGGPTNKKPIDKAVAVSNT